jgi:hypothetical protein
MTAGDLLGAASMRVAVLLAISACAYRPGSFHSVQQPFAGERVTTGCLDLAIDRRPQFRDDAGPVISYSFGNRCDHATPVDLANVVVYGRTPDGRQIRLAPYDPFVELKPLQLEGRVTGKEAIEYQTQQELADVCIDVASLNHAQPAQWVCLERTEARRTRGYFAEAQ